MTEETQFKPENYVWTEKWRPKKINEMVGNFKEKILKYLNKPESLPNFLLYSNSAGTGKCLIGNEMFLTKNGLFSFKEYCELHNIKKQYTILKDSIYCPENNFVDTTYFYKSKSNTIKITTSRGYEIEGTPNHKIKIFNNDGLVWKTLSDINNNDYIPIIFNTNIFNKNKLLDYSKFNKIKKKIHDNNSVDIKKPIKLNSDIGYLIGVFIANGTYDKNTINISTYKKWLQNKLLKIVLKNFKINGHYLKSKNKNIGISFTSIQLTNFFKFVLKIEKKTARYKEIPKIIRCCNKNIQLNFINGLFEDSHLSKQNNIEISTASEIIAKQLQIMLLNLGFIITKTKKYLKKYEHWYYKLYFSVEDSKKFILYFNGYFKNEKIKFGHSGSTNVFTYKNIIYKYIQNKRKQNGIRKYDVHKLNLETTKTNVTGYIPKVIKNLSLFVDKEPYLNELKSIIKIKPFLDTIKHKKYNNKKEIYDFHIPNTHKFWASGLINHNTSLAKAIINELDCDALIINSSSDRNIETIRDKVKEFSMTKTTKKGIKRCVFLDETDGMTQISQQALRNTMETYANNTFFILTCNKISRIIEPLQSRCIKIPFAYPDKEEITVYLKHICENEQMKYTDEAIKKLIEINYPSIRNCVLVLQDIKTEELDITIESVKPINNMFDDLWERFIDKDWKYIKKIVLKSTIDPRELNSFFWEKALYSDPIKLRVIQICCKNERDIALGSDSKIIFITSLIEMVK